MFPPGTEAWRVSYEFRVHDDDRRIVKCITPRPGHPAQSFDTIVRPKSQSTMVRMETVYGPTEAPTVSPTMIV